MAKTMKVLGIHNGAVNYCCIKHLDAAINPYWLYHLEWRNGVWHRKLLVKYGDFQSVIWYIHNESVSHQWQ